MSHIYDMFDQVWRPSHHPRQRAGGRMQTGPLHARNPPREDAMIHAVLHDAKDTVAVAVVEGITAGTELNAWIMDEDKIIQVKALQDIPIGHKVALKDMAVGDTVYKYGIDIGRVVAPIKAEIGRAHV